MIGAHASRTMIHINRDADIEPARRAQADTRRR
jgi:hypothetical protein